MEICFLARIPENNHGGVRRVIDELSSMFVKDGHSVNIILNKNKSHRFDYLTFPFRVFFSILGKKFDIVISHSSDGVIISMLSKIIPGLPKVIMHSHGWEECAVSILKKTSAISGYKSSWKSYLSSTFIRFALLKINLIFANTCVFVSKHDYEWVKDKYPKYSYKLVFIPNGYDPNIFYPTESANKEKNVVFAGTWIERKGKRVLPKILRDILSSDSNVKIYMLGLGITPAQQKEYFNDLDLNRIEFYDDLTKEQMAEKYRKASVFIQTSFYEGASISLVLLEAIACGVPCVVYAYEGLNELLENEEDVILVQIGDNKKFYEKVKYLLDNYDKSQLLANNARKKIKQYEWNKIAVKWYDVLKLVNSQ